MGSMRHVSQEDRIEIWSDEIQPVVSDMFISLKQRLWGEIGEIIEGVPLSTFCRHTLDVMGNEPMVSEYGVGISLTMPAQPYSKYARSTPPHHPFTKTKQGASLPLYVFGVSLKEFALSGFLTYYKILFNEKKFIDNELFDNSRFNQGLYNRRHSDFTLANMAICHNLMTSKSEWQYEDFKYSSDRKFISLTHNFEYGDMAKMGELIIEEFEEIGETVSRLEKSIPRKKTFGLF
jgi:hypothetical protein